MKRLMVKVVSASLIFAAGAAIAGDIWVCDRSRCYLTHDQVLICPPNACTVIKPPKGQP